MNGTIDEIVQKLNGLSDDLKKIQVENEELRKENAELKKQLAKLKAKESKPKAEARIDALDDIDVGAEDSSLKLVVKEKLKKMADAIIKHTSENEEKDVAEIVACWKNNDNASRVPAGIIKELITSQELSEESINIIFDEIKNENDANHGIGKNMPRKYGTLIENLALSKRIRGEKAQTLLEIYFNNFCRVENSGEREFWGAEGFYEIAAVSTKFTRTRGTREHFFVRKSCL